MRIPVIVGSAVATHSAFLSKVSVEPHEQFLNEEVSLSTGSGVHFPGTEVINSALGEDEIVQYNDAIAEDEAMDSSFIQKHKSRRKKNSGFLVPETKASFVSLSSTSREVSQIAIEKPHKSSVGTNGGVTVQVVSSAPVYVVSPGPYEADGHYVDSRGTLHFDPQRFTAKGAPLSDCQEHYSNERNLCVVEGDDPNCYLLHEWGIKNFPTKADAATCVAPPMKRRFKRTRVVCSDDDVCERVKLADVTDPTSHNRICAAVSKFSGHCEEVDGRCLMKLSFDVIQTPKGHGAECDAPTHSETTACHPKACGINVSESSDYFVPTRVIATAQKQSPRIKPVTVEQSLFEQLKNAASVAFFSPTATGSVESVSVPVDVLPTSISPTVVDEKEKALQAKHEAEEQATLALAQQKPEETQVLLQQQQQGETDEQLPSTEGSAAAPFNGKEEELAIETTTAFPPMDEAAFYALSEEEQERLIASYSPNRQNGQEEEEEEEQFYVAPEEVDPTAPYQRMDQGSLMSSDQQYNIEGQYSFDNGVHDEFGASVETAGIPQAHSSVVAGTPSDSGSIASSASPVDVSDTATTTAAPVSMKTTSAVQQEAEQFAISEGQLISAAIGRDQNSNGYFSNFSQGLSNLSAAIVNGAGSIFKSPESANARVSDPASVASKATVLLQANGDVVQVITGPFLKEKLDDGGYEYQETEKSRKYRLSPSPYSPDGFRSDPVQGTLFDRTRFNAKGMPLSDCEAEFANERNLCVVTPQPGGFSTCDLVYEWRVKNQPTRDNAVLCKPPSHKKRFFVTKKPCLAGKLCKVVDLRDLHDADSLNRPCLINKAPVGHCSIVEGQCKLQLRTTIVQDARGSGPLCLLPADSVVSHTRQNCHPMACELPVAEDNKDYYVPSEVANMVFGARI